MRRYYAYATPVGDAKKYLYFSTDGGKTFRKLATKSKDRAGKVAPAKFDNFVVHPNSPGRLLVTASETCRLPTSWAVWDRGLVL